LDVLHAAHQSLVVHLDIKPSNVLIDRAGRVRLVDFGTAKLLHASGLATETYQLTPSYASPEQLRGEPATAAADQYSAALTLVELITGNVARRSSLAALAERAQADTPAVSIPGEPDLTAILQKALRFAAADRYRSAAEFADDLRAWLDGRPVRARRATALYRLRRFVARHTAAVSAAAAGLILAAALVAYAYTQQQQRLREAERGAALAAFLRGMIDSSATAASGNPRMTVLQMIERAHQRIEGGTALPLEIGALLQSDFAYFTRESGRDREAAEMARAALRRADRSGDAEARLAARRTLAEIAIRLGRCEEAVGLYREADPLLPLVTKPLAQAGYLGARAASESRCQANPAQAVASLRRAVAIAQAVRPRDSALSPAVFRASLYNSLALELARQGRLADGRQAIAAGLREAEAHADGRYFRVALQRTLGQLEANAGRAAEALAAYERALAGAPGVVSPFEASRLALLAAGQQAALGQRQLAAKRVEATLAGIRREAAALGTARWMLLADAAEVQARAGACPAALALYAEVDTLTGGQMPRDWRANRLLHTAECTADAARAAALAREALAAYGPQLPADSPRRRRLNVLLSQQR
jgi:eukaryotic-like serine/threonine-protein kinase